MAKALTVVEIDRLPTPTARREIPDKIAGLFLIVQPTGKKSWAVRYRVAGKPRKHTLGSYPGVTLADARLAAQEVLGKVAKGMDPAADKAAAKAAAAVRAAPAKDEFGAVVDRFIDQHAKRSTRDWVETDRILRKEFLPVWAGRSLASIGPGDIFAVTDAMVARGAPVGANRAFAACRKLCSWAVQRGIISRSPFEGLRAPSPETSRDRVLEDHELAAIWNATESIGLHFRAIVRLLMLTGARRAEVGEMRWSEIDLDKRLWTIPGERSKNHRRHEIPLTPAAVEILAALPRIDRSDLIFTTTGTTAVSGYSRAKRQIDRELAGQGFTLNPWTFHDIRRSVASGMAARGVNLPVIERCLNHISGSFGGVAGIYQRHSFFNEMRAAFDRWGAHIDALVSGADASNVVDLANVRA